jgi:flagellar protein FliO/FliZ
VTIPRFILLLIAASPSAYAAEPLPSLGEGIGQLVLGLAVVIGLLLATLWMIKRLSSPRGAAAGLKVLGAVPVGPRERVVLVEVADKVLILGVAPGSVRALDSVATTDFQSRFEPDERKETAGDFASWLKRSMERGSNAS